MPCPPPGDLHNPGIEPTYPTLQVDSLLSEPPGKPCKINSEDNLTMCLITLGCCCLVAKLCLSPCNPMECSLPSSSVHEDLPGKNSSELPCSSPGHLLTQGSNPWPLHWQEDSISEPPRRGFLNVFVLEVINSLRDWVRNELCWI